MAHTIKPFARTLVATAPSPATSGTSLVVTAATGTTLPSTPFWATVCPVGVAPTLANAEIILVSARSTDTLSPILRAQGGTSARAIVVGDQIFQCWAPGYLQQLDIDVRDFGAKCDGVTDDTAAVQAALTAADTSPDFKTVRFPAGDCVISDTLTIGNNMSRYAYTSLRGESKYISRLVYAGPMDRPAVLISAVSAFSWRDLSVLSQYVGVFASQGTSVGVRLDGPHASGGTYNTQIIFENVGIAGFKTGMVAGGGDAASEILYTQVNFTGNSTGWTANGYNALNHAFHMLGLSDNEYGMKIGDPSVSEAPHIFSGHTSGNTIADFWVGNSFDTLTIENVRAELTIADAKFLGGLGAVHTVVLRNNVVLVDSTAFPVDIAAGKTAEVTGNVVSAGQVRIGAGAGSNAPYSVTFKNNIVPEGDTGYPLVMPYSRYGVLYELSGNVNYTAGDAGGNRQNFPDVKGLYTNALLTAAKSDYDINGTALMGTRLGPVALSHGIVGSGKNLRDVATFATSGTLAYTFKRTVSVTPAAGTTGAITFASGAIDYRDIGKYISLPARADCSAGYAWIPGTDSFDGRIVSIDSATSATIAIRPWVALADRCNPTITVTTAVNAVVGEDEPDANYMILLSGDAQETFSWSAKATTGFTITSSNPVSTATVHIMILR